MAQIKFTGFYPSLPFWAVSPVNFDVPRVDGWFHDQMAEEVYSKETDALALKVCRDGKILIRVESLEQRISTRAHLPGEELVQIWSEYLGYLNAFYLILDSATLDVDRLSHFNLHEVTTRDVFRVTYENGKELGGYVPLESVTRIYQMGRYVGSYRSEAEIERDPSIFFRRVVSREAILSASSLFEQLVSRTGAERSLASLAKSLSEYKVGNYDTSAILAWFIVESALNNLWEDHIQSCNGTLPDSSKRINRDRMDFLTGREFSASVVSNILELLGLLDHPLFGDVDATRKCRNKIVHPTRYRATAEEAQRAMKVAASMIERLWNIKVTLNTNFTVHGL